MRYHNMTEACKNRSVNLTGFFNSFIGHNHLPFVYPLAASLLYYPAFQAVLVFSCVEALLGLLVIAWLSCRGLLCWFRWLDKSSEQGIRGSSAWKSCIAGSLELVITKVDQCMWHEFEPVMKGGSFLRALLPGSYAITGADNLGNCAPPSRCQPYRPRNTAKRYLSNVNSWYKNPPSPHYSSVVQERLCTIPRRTYVTSYKEGPDGQGQASLSSVPSEKGIDPASLTEGTSSQGDSDISASQTPPVNIAVDSAFKASPRHDMALLFTCTVCDVRSAKTMSRATYETGVVIVRCPGCQNLHLIADRYGWFGEPGSVEDILAEKGIDVRKGTDSTYEFTMEDMSGWTPKGNSE